VRLGTGACHEHAAAASTVDIHIILHHTGRGVVNKSGSSAIVVSVVHPHGRVVHFVIVCVTVATPLVALPSVVRK